MPSPFPGMDPYLEQPDIWQDFHRTAIPVIRRELNPKLSPDFIVTIGTHVYLHELSAKERQMLGEPDVSILIRGETAGTHAVQAASSASPAMIGAISTQMEKLVVPFLEVRDRNTRDLITAIELLSPTNKRSGGDREQYLGKRLGYVTSDANLVEIDLLRGGAQMPTEGIPRCDYAVVVSRAANRPAAELYPIMLRDRLPVISIPLTADRPDVTLDLQAVLDQCFNEAGYERYIYDQEPMVPLSAEDKRWAVGLLTAAAKGTHTPKRNEHGPAEQ